MLQLSHLKIVVDIVFVVLSSSPSYEFGQTIRYGEQYANKGKGRQIVLYFFIRHHSTIILFLVDGI